MMQHLAFVTRQTQPLFNLFFAGYHVTQKPFVNITPKQLIDPQHISQILKTNLPQRTKRSQRGLFHARKTKSGNSYSESNNPNRRSWKPNAFEKSLYSEVLNKKLKIQITTKTLRCIRKYGGFDNYVLLTKPKNMDSLYGEYLRTLMMNKLNNPDFRVPYLVKSKPFDGKSSSWKHRYSRRPALFHPKDQRYTDLTQKRMKLPDEMSKKDIIRMKELEMLNKSYTDTQTNHPLLMKIQTDLEEQMDRLEPDRQKILAEFERKPSLKMKERVLQVFQKGKPK